MNDNTDLEEGVAQLDIEEGGGSRTGTGAGNTAAGGDGEDNGNYVYVDSASAPSGSAAGDGAGAGAGRTEGEGQTDGDGRGKAVGIATTESWKGEILEDPNKRFALNALTANDPLKVVTRRAVTIADAHTFNVKIGLEGSPVTNQRATGRCWLFATTNVCRVALMRKYNLKDFELSQAYLFFWDKFEKANYFLEQIIDVAASGQHELQDRLVQRLLAVPVQDGGQWDMAANVVRKYGLVPQSAYPDSFSASNSRTMAALITTKLREYALELWHLAQHDTAGIPATKERMLREIHHILVLLLGPPPSAHEPLTWEFYDRNDKFTSVSIKPLDIAKGLAEEHNDEWTGGLNVFNLFSIVNDPRNDYGKLLSVSRLGNVVDGDPVRYVNVDMDTIKTACVAMLKADLPVFFGADSGKFMNRQTGVFDTELFDLEQPFNIKLGLTKAQRLITGESEMTHAMVLTGVHLGEDGKPVRWRVQNSWGEDSGSKGWFLMTDRWMDQFVYQAVVDPKFVPKEITEVLKQEPKMLDLWDPMGSLA